MTRTLSLRLECRRPAAPQSPVSFLIVCRTDAKTFIGFLIELRLLLLWEIQVRRLQSRIYLVHNEIQILRYGVTKQTRIKPLDEKVFNVNFSPFFFWASHPASSVSDLSLLRFDSYAGLFFVW